MYDKQYFNKTWDDSYKWQFHHAAVTELYIVCITGFQVKHCESIALKSFLPTFVVMSQQCERGYQIISYCIQEIKYKIYVDCVRVW